MEVTRSIEAEEVGAAKGGPAVPRRPAARRRPLTHWAEAWALAMATIAICVAFTFLPATSAIFPTLANFQVVTSAQAVVGMVALAALIPLVCNEWDLSVGATAGLSSIVVAKALSDGVAVPVALLMGLAVGLLVGIVNAVIITKARVNAVITTLGVATVIAGIINQMTAGQAIVSNIPGAVTKFGSGSLLGIPYVLFVLLATCLVVGFVLGFAPVGRHLYAVGSNQVAAKLVGLRTRLLLGGTFVAAGILAGLAGALIVARAGGADPRVGDQLTLPALAAAFLSAAAVKPGQFNVGGAMVAIFFLASLNAGLNLAGAPPYVSNYVNGAALVTGVALTAYLGRRRSGSEL